MAPVQSPFQPGATAVAADRMDLAPRRRLRIRIIGSGTPMEFVTGNGLWHVKTTNLNEIITVRFSYFLLATILASAFVSPLSAQTSCRTADAISDDGLFLIREIVHGTTHGDSVLRSRLAVNATADSQVNVLTVDSLCAHAMSVRAADQGSSFGSSAVHVYKVGTQYWVEDPQPKKGRVMYVLSPTFAIVGLMRF